MFIRRDFNAIDVHLRAREKFVAQREYGWSALSEMIPPLLRACWQPPISPWNSPSVATTASITRHRREKNRGLLSPGRLP